MGRVHPDPEGILLTGDFVGHRLPTLALVNATLVNASRAVQAAFPKARVFPMLGNNDMFPDYAFPLEPTAWMRWLTAFWRDLGWLTPAQAATFEVGGYYEADLHANKQGKERAQRLRLLALNTVLYSRRWCPSNASKAYEDPAQAALPAGRAVEVCDRAENRSTDPLGQLAWLRARLAGAREDGWRVLIAGHIPPGTNSYNNSLFWPDMYVEAYSEVVREYQDVVINQVFAHTHLDAFRVMWDDMKPAGAGDDGDEARPFSSVSLAPSVSPVHSNNPSFRLYSYDEMHGVIADYSQYYIDLNQANRGARSPDVQGHWLTEYSFVGDLMAKGPTTEGYEQLHRDMATDPRVLARYSMFHTVMSFNDSISLYCAIGNSNQNGLEYCEQVMS